MIIDKLAAFADGQTVTGGTTTQATDVVDLGATGRKIGNGRPLYLVVVVLSKSNGDGADTFRFDLIDDDDISNGVMQSPRVVASTPTITGVANIAVGQKFVIPVPPGVALQRYVSAGYSVTADAVLTVDAFLTDDPTYAHDAYPDSPGASVTV